MASLRLIPQFPLGSPAEIRASPLFRVENNETG